MNVIGMNNEDEGQGYSSFFCMKLNNDEQIKITTYFGFSEYFYFLCFAELKLKISDLFTFNDLF